MNYDLNIEQTMLKESARKFLTGTCTSDFIKEMKHNEKGYIDELWKKMAELGWMAILIPEEYGGIGGSFLDMAVLLQEMGYGCLPGPFFPTAVAGTVALNETANEEQKKSILPGIATGERLTALAWLEEEGFGTADGIHLKAEKKGNEFILNGTKLFVKDAHVANTIICVARTEGSTGEYGISLFIIDSKTPGLTINQLHVYSGDKLSELLFNQVQDSKGNFLGEMNQGWKVFKRIMLKCSVLRCAEMIGGAEKVLEMVSRYSKERVQFGHPIGSFQAIQHHCANMLMEADTSKLLTYKAAWLISEGLEYETAAMICKAYVSDSYRHLLKIGAQVMGGTGFCEEHDFHLYCQRGKAAELDFGDAEFHREWLAQKLGL